jgi:hypothetical protein
MFAYRRRNSHRRCVAALLASLMLAAGIAAAEPNPALDQRISEIREVGRFVPNSSTSQASPTAASGIKPKRSRWPKS